VCEAVLDKIADRRPKAAAGPALGGYAGSAAAPLGSVPSTASSGVSKPVRRNPSGSSTSSRTASEYPPSNPAAASQYPALE
jgi:hypothetical protein